MTFRIDPKIYLIFGSLSWVLFALFHLVINYINQSFDSITNITLYLVFFGSFSFSFFRYYDLTISKIGREDIYLTFFRLFIFSIKCIIPVVLSYIILLFDLFGKGPSSIIINSFIYNLTLGSSTIFCIICFLISKRLIYFESSVIMKRIMLILNYGFVLMYVFDMSPKVKN